MHFITNFMREESGVTAIEYGLIAALIAGAIVLGASALGISMSDFFQRIGDCMNTPNPSCLLIV